MRLRQSCVIKYIPIMLQLVFLIYISCHGTFHGHCTDITELFIDWWTHDQSQQSNLRPTFVIIILRVVLLNLDMFLLTNMVLSKGSLKMPRVTISWYFHFILLIHLFFWKFRSKKSREKSFSWINRFLSRFFNMKKFYSWKSLVKSGLHNHNRAAFFVKSFLPEVISRSQVPQNSKILYLCFRKRLLQNWHGSDWSIITVCVILVSSYLIHELPYLIVWNAICLRPESHMLVQSQ